MSKAKYVDIHCHPSMKPFYSSMHYDQRENLWNKVKVKPLPDDASEFIVKQVEEMIKFSQVNLDASQKGNLGVLFASLYPVEREWFDKSGFIQLFSDDEKMAELSVHTSGFDKDVMDNLIKRIRENTDEINYFEELVAEYYYLTSDQAKSDDANKQFVVANNYDELQSAIDNPTISAVIIVTIEGGHSLISFANHEALEKTPYRNVNNRNKSDFKNYRKIIFDNIDTVKGKNNVNIKVDFSGTKRDVHFKHTPFFITFAHHFWNLLCGHADSMSVLQGLVLQQGRGEERKFTELGKDVIRKLLHRDEDERRILIDIKHLGIKARREFFKMWENEYNKKGDPFPIIASHTAVNGREKYFGRLEQMDQYDAFFNTAAINMFDHDIRIVYKSDGLIGVILNEGRLPGFDSKEILKFNKRRIKKNRKKIKDNPDAADVAIWKNEIEIWENENKQEYLTCLAANIFHIREICGHPRGWDIITIGSDFDGMIDALDAYQTAEDFPMLADDLQEFLEKANGIPEIGLTKSNMTALMDIYNPEQLVEKIMKTNAIEFMHKYFHDDFLKQGVVRY